MTNKESVLVTGAAGGVGTYLVKKLLESGYRVKATDLPGKEIPFAGHRVKIVHGDITDPEFIKDLPLGTSMVIHCAAALDISLPWSVLYRINTEAAVRLWERSAELGIMCFVHFSSGSIYAPKMGPIREDDPTEPTEKYERSKLLSERRMLRTKFERQYSTKLVILRPALIIGPGGTALMNRLATVPPLFKEYLGFALKFFGGPKTNTVHALDVARAAVHLMIHGQDGEAYNVAIDEAVPFSDYFNFAAQEYGLATIPLPVAILPSGAVAKVLMPFLSRPELYWGLNTAVDFLWNRLRKKYNLEGDLAPKLDKEAASYFARDTIFDNSKLRSTGFDFIFPDARSCVRDLMLWYKENHWIP